MLLEEEHMPGRICKILLEIALDGFSSCMIDNGIWSSDDRKACRLHSPGQVYIAARLKSRVKSLQHMQNSHAIRCISGNNIGSIVKREILRRKLLLCQVFSVNLHPRLWLSFENPPADTTHIRVVTIVVNNDDFVQIFGVILRQQ